MGCGPSQPSKSVPAAPVDIKSAAATAESADELEPEPSEAATPAQSVQPLARPGPVPRRPRRLVNVNTASKQRLCTVRGIGSKTGQDIFEVVHAFLRINGRGIMDLAELNLQMSLAQKRPILDSVAVGLCFSDAGS